MLTRCLSLPNSRFQSLRVLTTDGDYTKATEYTRTPGYSNSNNQSYLSAFREADKDESLTVPIITSFYMPYQSDTGSFTVASRKKKKQATAALYASGSQAVYFMKTFLEKLPKKNEYTTMLQDISELETLASASPAPPQIDIRKAAIIQRSIVALLDDYKKQAALAAQATLAHFGFQTVHDLPKVEVPSSELNKAPQGMAIFLQTNKPLGFDPNRN